MRPAVPRLAEAAEEWVDAIKPLERFDWLSNRLVLVVRKEAGDPDLRQLESLALAGEEVPAAASTPRRHSPTSWTYGA